MKAEHFRKGSIVNRLRVFSAVVAALLLGLAVPGHGAEEGAAALSQPLFENQDILHIRIEAPLSTLMRERSDTEYLDGTLIYTDASGNEQVLDLKLRARGNYRKQARVCDMPPVRLNFKKKQVMGTEFAGQDKLKLVTYCEEGRGMYEQYVLKEYLAYKIFNVMTDMSFRARLLRVDYVNSERDGETDTRYSFLIEDDDALAERIQATVLKVPYIRYSQLDAQHAALASAFEYLIGNTDFSMVVGAKDDDCCHNFVLFSKESDGYLAIPYDFDFSGLVDASYAEPNPKLPIRSVTRRLYRGICSHNDELGPVLDRFREKKPEILGLVTSLEGLEPKMRDKATVFLNGFYRNIADEESVNRYILSKCQSEN
jgi:hypothetical protein